MAAWLEAPFSLIKGFTHFFGPGFKSRRIQKFFSSFYWKIGPRRVIALWFFWWGRGPKSSDIKTFLVRFGPFKIALLLHSYVVDQHHKNDCQDKTNWDILKILSEWDAQWSKDQFESKNLEKRANKFWAKLDKKSIFGTVCQTYPTLLSISRG